MQNIYVHRRGFIKSAFILGSTLALGSRYSFADEAPKKGGNLRVAILGGGPTETLDPHVATTPPDGLRVPLISDSLFTIANDGKIVYALAESADANSGATEWTIRVRDALFHDGRPVTADDVIATLRRIANPSNPLYGAAGLDPVDLNSLTAVDKKTVRIPLKYPCAALPEILSAYYNYAILPADFNLQKPIATGPFMVENYTPGQGGVFKRFDGYYQGPAHLDQVTVVTSFTDANAAYNALQSGEIDVLSYAPLTLARQVEGASGGDVKVLVSNPGQWVPFTMRVDTAPFDNPDVRMAFKLLVDREQIIKVALNGYGQVADDLFSPLDRDFDHTLKRVHDPDQAKSLLKKAGLSDLKVDLVTADISTGAIQSSQILAQQAKAIGVTVNVQRVTTDLFWAKYYKNAAFSQNFWGYSPYVSQVSQCMIKGAPYNETYWDDAGYKKLYDEVQSTLDPAKRTEIVHAMQRIEFDRSGYIIPSFNVVADLMRKNVQGFEKSSNGYGLGTFEFAKAWLS